MRYVGKENDRVYLRCGHCKNTHPYILSDLEQPEKRVCALCGKPFRRVFFRPVQIQTAALKPWLPPLFMLLLSVLLFLALRSPFLLHKYQFNVLINSSHSLLSSIIVTIISAVLAELLSRNHGESSRKKQELMPRLVLIGEGALLIFILNTELTLHYGPLQINDPKTNELQQYFGSTVGGYASGEGRLFDRQGNLIYYGGFNNSLYDGYGVKYELIDPSSSVSAYSYQLVYEGDFKNGLYDGTGREYRYDADYTFAKDEGKNPHLYYEGEFSNGKYCGNGTLYGTGETYRGGFFDGTYNGYGTRWNLSSSKIYRFVGYFRDGVLDGPGTKFYPSGQPYFDGEYENGIGVSGTVYYEDGTLKYKGGLKDDRYDGKGIFYWENGTVKYDGDWSNGMRQGTGTSYREDGTKAYEGGWSENSYSGYGEAYYDDGVTLYYKGRWSDGQKNGAGIEYYQNEHSITRYDGSWWNGKLSGKALWYWENGELFYDGHFENGVMSGYGKTYSEKHVLVYEGYFANGQRNGQGNSYWSDGKTISYSGEWADDVRSGIGKEYTESGELLYEGLFENGQFVG